MFRYRVIELRCFSQELGRHSKYGVLAEQKRRGSWIAKAVTAELPANREAVTALAENGQRTSLTRSTWQMSSPISFMSSAWKKKLERRTANC